MHENAPCRMSDGDMVLKKLYGKHHMKSNWKSDFEKQKQWSNGAGEAILGHIESEVVENGEILCMMSSTKTYEILQKENDLTAK